MPLKPFQGDVEWVNRCCSGMTVSSGPFTEAGWVHTLSTKSRFGDMLLRDFNLFGSLGHG